MLLSTINTWLLFSLICKKRTIPRGNTVSSKIYIARGYEEIYPFLLAIVYPTELFQYIQVLFCLIKYFITKKVSTTLFNIKINDIVEQVDPGVECSLFVDDFVIMYISPTIDAIQRKLQHTIHSLEKWTLDNGFTISKKKTVAMHFCPDKKCWIQLWNKIMILSSL